jgi:phosphoenolpyruvate carboxylase
LDALAELLRALPVESAVPIARAFSHFLTLANIAEQHHRVRRRRDYLRDPNAVPQRGSCEETFERLLASGITPDALHAATMSLRVELVLTAHPTAITRRTLIQKHLRIAGALASQDRVDLTAPERAEIVASLRREILAAWETDEIRSRRPTPVDEAIAGLLIFEQTLWDAVPRFLRTLGGALARTTGRSLPLDAAPLRFGSWMGGDRDGNPTVTPEVTRLACSVARWMAADLYEREIAALRSELSITAATPELRARANGAREPYRAVLREVRDRLRATREALGADLSRADLLKGDSGDPIVADQAVSLRRIRQGLPLSLPIAPRDRTERHRGRRLTDVLRRLAAFGLTLVRLDLEQHAQRCAEAIDAIRGITAWGRSRWDEPRRQALLRSRHQPLAPSGRTGRRGGRCARDVRAGRRMNPSRCRHSWCRWRRPRRTSSPSRRFRFAEEPPARPFRCSSASTSDAPPTRCGPFSRSRMRARISGRQSHDRAWTRPGRGRLASNWALIARRNRRVCRNARRADALSWSRRSISRGGGPTYWRSVAAADRSRAGCG